MSLINDALKRARQTGPVPESVPAQADPSLRPVEYQKAPNLWPVFLFPLSLVLLLGTGAWFFLTGWDGGKDHDSGKLRVRARQTSPEPAEPAKEQASPQDRA
ncbi:MAG TPA: hypothetical protein VGE41_03735, partial [Verrucomicrobiae bacterium]